MTVHKYSGNNVSQIEIILRLVHVLRQLELSSKWCRKVHTNSEYAFMGEAQIAEFFYNYFTPHNKG